MKQEKCKSSEGKCGNVSKIIASSSPEGWMSRSGEEVALGAGDNSDLKTTMTKSKNIRESLAFVLCFSFYLCTLFVIVFVYCMAFAVHWWWLFDNEWGSAEDSHGRLSREHQSINPAHHHGSLHNNSTKKNTLHTFSYIVQHFCVTLH